MTVFFILTKDNIQKAVKLETSILAERRRTKEGVEMLDDLIMDEEYDILFRRYMQDAHAEVILNIPSNFLIDMPTDIEPFYSEFPDFSQDTDFFLYVNLHDDWPENYRKSIDYKLQQFLIDYICYRWLENKSPDDAQGYFNRLDKTIDDIKRMFVRKTTPIRRLPSFP